jgi:hypothetical protein
MPELQTVQKIGKYEIVSVLGRGAMGVVYRAFDRGIGRQVAIKTLSGALPDDSEFRLRFIREARSLGQLHHPNIVTVHDFFEEAGTAYLVMELLEGASLHWLIRNKTKALVLEEKLSILQQIASGLQNAHERGIVHRDLKPSNIFVDRRGVAKVLDFGVAKVGQGELTQAGTVFGTLEYMAPEQLRAEPVDARADTFSLGVVAYEILSGRNPFRADTPAATVFKLLSDDPEGLAQTAGVAPAVEAVVRRAIAKKKDGRFSGMSEFSDALQAAVQELGIALRLPALSEAEVAAAAGVDAASLDSREHHWSNIAAVAGQLERLYAEGIDCFGSGDYEGCVERMGQVLDEAQVHAMALHYLSQSEERLRQKRLEPEKRREVAGLLVIMRRASRQGEGQKVLETVGKILALDPECMEARWYRRAAETRLTPARSRQGAMTHASRSRLTAASAVSMAARLSARPDAGAALALPKPDGGSALPGGSRMWLLGGVAALFLSLMGAIWLFTGDSNGQAAAAGAAARPSAPSPVRPSLFDETEGAPGVQLSVAPRPPAPTVTGVLPEEIPVGSETEILVSGSNFLAEAALVASPSGPAEATRPVLTVISSRVTNKSLLQAKVRVEAGTQPGEVALAVVHPDGGRSAEFQLKLVAP